jgi:L-asparaginase/Glu-tRNA(Gln) amidotransferase subunit D
MTSNEGPSRPRIAVFSGPTSTIENSEPLLTSNKARRKYGLPPLTHPDGSEPAFDVLRPQRLAAPVTVYVTQHSAHPLEADAADLAGPPDGYLDGEGEFHDEPTGPDDVPVFEIELRPEDGVYPLPFMGRRADGTAWDPGNSMGAREPGTYLQTFYPDASRVFEEIDRLGVAHNGTGSMLSARAEFDFFRAAPSGGYLSGEAADERTDTGDGDIAPEVRGEDYFPYLPPMVKREPPLAALARVTNLMQSALASGDYAGAIWMEGSPNVEETTYWLNLLLDTRLPIVGTAAQRAHGALSSDGDRNLVDAVAYITSDAWSPDGDGDAVGAVVIQEQRIFTSREVQKSDARPGGYAATGGHGGVIGTTGDTGPDLTFIPVRRHTHESEVNISRLPSEVPGVGLQDGELVATIVSIKTGEGRLREDALPSVTMTKHARYLPEEHSGGADDEPDLMARIARNLDAGRLAGFVAEGTTPFGSIGHSVSEALKIATFSGMPVVKTGRGDPGGFVDSRRVGLAIAGSNLTATKARLLLMACLLRFGSLPPAADPAKPTGEEFGAVKAKLAQYQAVFDTH